MIQDKNVIKKLNVEIETSSLQDAYYFKDHIDTYFRDKIYPEIEAILDKLQYEVDSKIVRFGTIPIEINISSKDSLNDIKPFIINKLKNILTINTAQNSNIIKTTYKATENKLNAFLFYLEKGRMPWWFTAEESFDSTTLKHITNDPLFVSKLAPILTNINVQKRLVLQLNDEALIEVVLAITNVSKYNQNTTPNLRVIKDIRLDFWQVILAQIAHKDTSKYVQELEVLAQRISGNATSSNKHFKMRLKSLEQHILPLINLSNTLSTVGVVIKYSKKDTVVLQLSEGRSVQLLNVQNQDTIKAIQSDELRFVPSTKIVDGPESTMEYQQSPQTDDALEDGIIVENAGLVLLHPFLKQLFNNLGFLSEDKKIKESSLSEALGVLHFLATKQETPNEQDLLCEKFICDIPFEEAISPVSELSEKQKNACDEMLEAVLTHWPALKTKNIDVLRSEFLTREGKVTVEGEKENLFIQRKTQDMLLDKLPWNISLMKLPWKENFVFLEW